MIDVREFLRVHGVEELNRSAEAYFAEISDWTYLLAKPFTAPDECAKLLAEFRAALQGLGICAQMKVLDFGPGSCWTSHFLSQMGCKVYACDVSATALEMGRARYKSHPPFGCQPEPEFLVYDGFRFPLPDRSIDRVLCMHALHHVPNVRQIIGEMARVLNDIGVAAFTEPGPSHSRDPISQQELDRGVLENDIIIEEIWDWAKAAGFQRLELTAFPIERVGFSLEEYRKFLAADPEIDRRVIDPVRRHADATRTFFLYKEANSALWSTSIHGLAAALEVRMKQREFRPGGQIRAAVIARNTGEAAWIQGPSVAGTVLLGFHLKDLGSGEYIRDYGRAALTRSSQPIRPGEEVRVEVELRAPTAGTYELTFDLVSEYVCWFADQNCSKAAVFRIEVV